MTNRGRLSAFVRSWATCIGAAIAYGILHDLITIQISPEYFLIGHPRILATEDRVLTALAWGVVSTWWVGSVLGLALTGAATLGKRPAIALRELVRPMLLLLAIMGGLAFIAALATYLFLHQMWPFLFGESVFPSGLGLDAERRYATAAAAHGISYISGALGGLALAIQIFRRRLRHPRETATPRSGHSFRGPAEGDRRW